MAPREGQGEEEGREMKPYQTFRHTVEVKLDCEAHLCGRCRFLTDGVCGLYHVYLGATAKGYTNRSAICKDSEISARPDPHTIAQEKAAKKSKAAAIRSWNRPPRKGSVTR